MLRPYYNGHKYLSSDLAGEANILIFLSLN